MATVTIVIYANREAQSETVFWRKDDGFTLGTRTDQYCNYLAIKLII